MAPQKGLRPVAASMNFPRRAAISTPREGIPMSANCSGSGCRFKISSAMPSRARWIAAASKTARALWGGVCAGAAKVTDTGWVNNVFGMSRLFTLTDSNLRPGGAAVSSLSDTAKSNLKALSQSLYRGLPFRSLSTCGAGSHHAQQEIHGKGVNPSRDRRCGLQRKA